MTKKSILYLFILLVLLLSTIFMIDVVLFDDQKCCTMQIVINNPVDNIDQQLQIISSSYGRDDLRPINRTPGYPFHDDRLLSSQNNIYLDKYKLHYCKIDKNMGSTMQVD